MEITSKFLLIILLLTANNAYSKADPVDKAFDIMFGGTLFITLLPTMLVATPTVYLVETQNQKALKPIIEAKPDAIAYIAANGENYHTARLENAFKILREKHPKATDMELAKMIINNYR